jgi:hypothetical protein
VDTTAQPDSNWPALPLEAWQDTYDTLKMWTQVAGKIRMTLSPKLNHWWHTTLYVNSHGLTTSSIPYGGGLFEIQFDFLEHQLEVQTSGDSKSFPLTPEPVAAFYARLMATLRSLGIEVDINTKPQEVPDAIPFEKDYRHASYDRDYANRWWRILVSSDIVMNEFRSRFSGRPAPPRKGVITSEAYSHECISAGFWPGGGLVAGPAYYSYTAPQPPGIADEAVRPAAAFWHKDFSEFILMYEDVRRAESPRAALLEFLESTYAAGAKRANWDRAALERRP